MEVATFGPAPPVRRLQLRTPSTGWVVAAAQECAHSAAPPGAVQSSLSRGGLVPAPPPRRNEHARIPPPPVDVPGASGVPATPTFPPQQVVMSTASSCTTRRETGHAPDVQHPRFSGADVAASAAFPFPVRVPRPASFYPTPAMSPDLGAASPEPLSGDLGVFLTTAGDFSAGLLSSLEPSASAAGLAACRRVVALPDFAGVAKIAGAVLSPTTSTHSILPALGCRDGTLFDPRLKDAGEDALPVSKITMSEMKQMEELDVTWSAMMTSVLDSDCVSLGLATEMNWTDSTLCGVVRVLVSCLPADSAFNPGRSTHPGPTLDDVLPSPEDGFFGDFESPLAVSQATGGVYHGVVNAGVPEKQADTGLRTSAENFILSSAPPTPKVATYTAAGKPLEVSMPDSAVAEELLYIPEVPAPAAMPLLSAGEMKREGFVASGREESTTTDFDVDDKRLAFGTRSDFANDMLESIEDMPAGQTSPARCREPECGCLVDMACDAVLLARELGTVGERVKRNRERTGRGGTAAAAAFSDEDDDDDRSELISIDEDDSGEYCEENSSDGEFKGRMPAFRKAAAAAANKPVPASASSAEKSCRRSSKRSGRSSWGETGNVHHPAAPKSRRRVSTSSSSSGFGSGSRDSKRSGRPYECATCDAAFSRGHDLRRHERIHSQVRDFQCDMCCRRFSRRDALKRHEGVCRSGGKCRRAARREPSAGPDEIFLDKAAADRRRPVRRAVKRAKARPA
ncbi:MAG: hypothetical protein BJ554DRAFT_7578 [Olpidium bornovanus]|uniref:C2H2-type domain-containing protein n=1 Tax=Olpidium bornovanus TaxID=278681 RepID=A0A8H7ZWP0_9FUNG|nr:MAG: hypothetical protein BJ554DRAFT_7578 [Olpidium bornovanus]